MNFLSQDLAKSRKAEKIQVMSEGLKLDLIACDLVNEFKNLKKIPLGSNGMIGVPLPFLKYQEVKSALKHLAAETAKTS